MEHDRTFAFQDHEECCAISMAPSFDGEPQWLETCGIAVAQQQRRETDEIILTIPVYSVQQFPEAGISNTVTHYHFLLVGQTILQSLKAGGLGENLPPPYTGYRLELYRRFDNVTAVIEHSTTEREHRHTLVLLNEINRQLLITKIPHPAENYTVEAALQKRLLLAGKHSLEKSKAASARPRNKKNQTEETMIMTSSLNSWKSVQEEYEKPTTLQPARDQVTRTDALKGIDIAVLTPMLPCGLPLVALPENELPIVPNSIRGPTRPFDHFVIIFGGGDEIWHTGVTVVGFSSMTDPENFDPRPGSVWKKVALRPDGHISLPAEPRKPRGDIQSEKTETLAQLLLSISR